MVITFGFDPKDGVSTTSLSANAVMRRTQYFYQGEDDLSWQIGKGG